MTTVDDLWYLADEATQQAEQTYHRLGEEYDRYIEFEASKRVSRQRFRTVAERIKRNGAPYGAHTLAYRGDGELVLVRHDAVESWVLPGGQADGEEEFPVAARRELREEAGIDAAYDGLGMLGSVTFFADEHSTWGVLPLFEAEALDDDLSVQDPDGEISDARWFEDLPPDARDREQLQRWRDRRF